MIQLNFPSVLRQNSSSFLLEDVYRNPGPLQFEGPGVDSNPISLCVEDQDYMGRIKKVARILGEGKTYTGEEYIDNASQSSLHCKLLH